MPDEPELAVGDEVRANGRLMTVERVYEPNFLFRYRCSWWEDGLPHHELFRRGDFERVDNA